MSTPVTTSQIRVSVGNGANANTVFVSPQLNVRQTFGSGCFLVKADSNEVVSLDSRGTPMEDLDQDFTYRLMRLPQQQAKGAKASGCIADMAAHSAAGAGAGAGAGGASSPTPQQVRDRTARTDLAMAPIGILRSVFKQRNGTPRQGSVCPSSRAQLKIEVGTNPAHFAIGLEEFSHVWLLFVFNQNTNAGKGLKATVKPPRLDGAKTGVLSTRTPHRPNPIGLSLCKLESVDKDVITLSGVDILDGTPILDVKPYIPSYDHVPSEQCKIPQWLCDPPVRSIDVRFSEAARAQLAELAPRCRFFKDVAHLESAIEEVLRQDPRSVYRRTQRADEDYAFGIDEVDVTTTFVAANGGAGASAEEGDSGGGRQVWKEVLVLKLEHRSIREELEARVGRHGSRRKAESGGEDGQIDRATKPKVGAD